MAKTKTTPAQRTRKAEQAARLAKARLDKSMADLQRQQVHKALAMLTAHQGADRGRRNKDWRPQKGSADLAILPEADTLNARSRDMVRNSWMAKSIVKAFARNVVGTGITPIPTVKGPDGTMLKAVNRTLMRMFWEWAADFKWCDLEGRQTYWEKQSLTIKEWVTVGEHFIIWNYQRHAEKVGLRLQSFEPEQLDTTRSSYLDPATGERREVRGGVEVDEYGAAVAYHFYRRNPNDYIGSSPKSERIPAHRVFHFMEQERVLQVRGVTQLAPVLQQIRDTDRYDNAHLMRTLMEACIGVLIKKTVGTGNGPLALSPATGDNQTTSGGMREIDFTPGMAPELLPGEDVVPFTPSSPNSTYEAFIKAKQRAIGAGVGLSYGQVSRQSESNYSAARQDSLEDRKEFEPLQEWLANKQVIPIYALFVSFAVMEGRLDAVEDFDADAFADNPVKFGSVEYVAPAPPWIDPEKEINAYEKAIRLHVMDRTQVIALTSGRRREDVWATISGEQQEAKTAKIALTEVVEADAKEADAIQKKADAFAKTHPPAPDSQGPDPELERIKAEADAYGVGVRAGVITPQPTDEKAFREKFNLPEMGDEAKEAWEKDGNVRRPITIAPQESPQPGEEVDGGINSAPATGDGQKDEHGKQKNKPGATEDGAKGSDAASLAARLGSDQLAALTASDTAPNYRLSDKPETVCALCRHFSNGKCTAYPIDADPQHTCDAFEAPKQETPATPIATPPVLDGERVMDDPRSSYLDRGERGVSGSGN